MKRPFQLIDAFVDEGLRGNPAGVVLLEAPISESLMQEAANEVNQAETAYLFPMGDDWSLRWFTPTVEVDLCGHATLASARALLEWGKVQIGESVRFHTKSGLLEVRISSDSEGIMQFPPKPATPAALDILPGAIWTGQSGMDWMAVLASEEAVESFVPDMAQIGQAGLRGLIITARGSGEDDVVSRFFAPQSGVPEDSVTGSAHCTLAPYWQAELGKDQLVCRQASERGGRIWVEGSVVLRGKSRVRIDGAINI